MFQFRLLCAGQWIGFFFLTASACLNAKADDPNGRKLFVERWSSHDKRSSQGDGLGPMHNATSCAACHHQGGAGGGGSRQHNVELLSVVPLDSRKADPKNLAKQLIAFHPGFRLGNTDEAQPNIVLHRFGSEGDYFDFRARLLGIEDPRPDEDPARRAVLAVAMAKRRRNKLPIETLEPIKGISFKLTQRNTPALWGAGLIDVISDSVIKENADLQRREFPTMAGRVPRASGGGVGRFGWRGQTDTLRRFVMIACANELGLQTKDHAQALNPLTPDYQPTGHDMNDADVDALVKFVNDLPKPIESVIPALAERIREGENVFANIGCAVCHPRELGKVNGLFSDLLLHDMGVSLADPVEPNPEVVMVSQRFFGYSGTGSLVVEKERRDSSLPQQWRTPPLWGLRDSAPYLHDGRADTILDAILLHGGQAEDSVIKFRNLSSAGRICLLAFLESLQSPPQPILQ